MNAELTLPLVRPASPDDFEQIMELCRELYKENATLDVHWPTVEVVIMNGVNGNNAIIGCIGEVGKLQAIIYLQISMMWYSQEHLIEEIFAFVSKPYRKSKNSQALIEYAKNMSDHFKVPLLIGILSNKQTKAKVRLYQKHIGEAAGAYFLYGAKTGKE